MNALRIFRRTSQKQYDGPATANVDHNEWNPTHGSSSRTNGNGNGNGNGDRRRSSSQRQSSSSSSNHRQPPQPSSSSVRRRSSENDRNGSRYIDVRSQPLASGISSRRTSNPMVARVMSSVPEAGGGGDNRHSGGIPMSIGVDKSSRSRSRSGRDGGGGGEDNVRATTVPSNFPKPKRNNGNGNNRPRMPMPMEHDGGVLCLCAIPTNKPNNRDQDNYNEDLIKHRFLSGGADGTVKLWEVQEAVEEESRGGGDNGRKKKGSSSREMIPKLVKTYRGHSGYVHSIAILGALSDDHDDDGDGGGVTSNNTTSNHVRGNSSINISGMKKRFNMHRKNRSRDSLIDLMSRSDPDLVDESARSINTEDSPRSSLGNSRHGHGRQQQRRRSSSSRHMPGMPFKRPSYMSLDSGGNNSNEGARRKANLLGKRLLFVSASRDNTLRLWPIDHHDNDNNNGEQEGYFDDGGFDETKSHGSGNRRGEGDPFAKGMKLRGHEFGPNNLGGGVLCVCALPSLAPDNRTANDDAEDDEYNNPRNSNMESTTISAGQFCSGGSDGRIRVWDVRSALNLRNQGKNKVPKSGMYGTVQLQCIDPLGHPGSGGGHGRGRPPPAAIASLICTHRGVQKEMAEVALFAGDARGTIRRYSRMNESGTGHVNGSIWWGCTALFAGHINRITSMSMLSSRALLPLLCPNMDIEDEEADGDVGTMLVSSCDNGSICVWDAFDTRVDANDLLEESENSQDYDDLPDRQTNRRRIPNRKAMWEIELNDNESNDCPLSHSNTDRSSNSNHVGVISLTTLQVGTLMAAGTTDGAIRMWNVSSGLYEGAYNLGGSVQIWSLEMLSERDVSVEEDCYDDDGDDVFGKRRKVNNAGIIVSGDNRGRIRVMRKISSRVENV